MNLEGKKIGVAFTGSFCTFEKAFTELQKLKDVGADIYPILSNASQSITSRFGSPAVYMEKSKISADENRLYVLKAQNRLGPKPILISL